MYSLQIKISHTHRQISRKKDKFSSLYSGLHEWPMHDILSSFNLQSNLYSMILLLLKKVNNHLCMYIYVSIHVYVLMHIHCTRKSHEIVHTKLIAHFRRWEWSKDMITPLFFSLYSFTCYTKLE